jgi:hypothetical protein
MLERRSDPDDRRHRTLVLFERGERIYRSAEAELSRAVGALLAGVPPPEADALGRLLPHVEAALGGTPPLRRRPRPPKPHRGLNIRSGESRLPPDVVRRGDSAGTAACGAYPVGRR